MAGIEVQIVDFLRNLIQSVGWVGVVVAMAIESACIPLPSEVTMPLAGWMLVRDLGLGPWNLLWAGFYGAVGCTIGSAIAYWVGALGGRPLVERYGKYVLISTHHLETADRWFARWGQATAFFSRLLPVVRTFISFPAGVTRMNFPKFLLYSFLGSFPWSLGLAYAGYLTGEHWEDIRNAMRPFDLPIAAIIVLLIVFFIYRNLRFRGRRQLADQSD
ncbi:MAG: DedA family protein [Chloroflexi bacterium]|nr:DedA family protein [Chloroflexota bacterium]